MKHIRYKFNDNVQATEKIDSLFTIDEDGNKIPNSKFAVINLGKFVLQNAELDSNGDIVTEAILTDGHAVDVIWYDLEESPYGWKSYEIIPNSPRHKIL